MVSMTIQWFNRQTFLRRIFNRIITTWFCSCLIESVSLVIKIKNLLNYFCVKHCRYLFIVHTGKGTVFNFFKGNVCYNIKTCNITSPSSAYVYAPKCWSVCFSKDEDCKGLTKCWPNYGRNLEYFFLSKVVDFEVSIIICEEVDIAYILQLPLLGLTPEKWKASWRDERNSKRKGGRKNEGKERRGKCKSELQRVCSICLLTLHNMTHLW